MRLTSILTVAAALGAVSISVPASAANTATANGRALLLLPLTLTKEQDLDFGTVVSSSTAGTVTVYADGVTSRSSTGGVTKVASADGERALFAWAGTPGQSVTFSITSTPASLDNGAQSVPVSLLYVQPTSAIVDGTGVVEVGVGGSISIGANQAEGTYTNTFDITADYP